LVNRAPQLGDEIDWRQIDGYSSYQSFLQVWQGKTPEKRSYFDNMTRFDFKTLLPALLQVEDRVSMAHGLESRVPFLDHPLVEFAATIPSNVKFKDGQTKHALKQALSHVLPDSVANRTDKMGFPVPLNEWMRGPAREFVREVFTSQKALTRGIVDNRRVVEKLDHESKFGRTLWGLLSLELWQQTFHDCAHEYKAMMRG
jgi:asparagine synthase (glutamine-hydrolysing)